MKAYKTIKSLLQCIVLTVPFMLSGLGSAEARVLSTTSSTPDFAAIDDYVEERMRELRIPGLAMGIVEGDRIIHLKGFGIAGSDGRPVTPQTPFQINSLGKPMTGVAIMQLVEAGKLDLDAPVQRYLPWFRVADEAASARITPRHLLSHTSGLPEAAGMEQAFSEDGRPDALEQRVRALRSVQLNWPVGASYEYSNAGYMTLGMLVQEISGQPYEAYMRAYLYTPLEMRQTFTDWTEARAHGAASGHRYWFGVPMASDLPVNRANLPAGAHMSASAEDVAHFLIAQLGGGRFGDSAILSAQGIAALQRPTLPSAEGGEFRTMGWDIVTSIGSATTIIKTGASANFRSMMLLLPERGLGLVVLMNANKGLDSSLGDQQLLRLPYNVAAMLLGQQPTVFPADPKPKLLYAILFLCIIVQMAGMARTLRLLQGWCDQPGLRPQGRTALVTRLGLPLLCNLGWGLFTLMGVPKLFGAPLSYLIYVAPDFGYTLLVSGVVALAWGVVRTLLVCGLLRDRPTAAVAALEHAA